jgi:hypothetical protein
MVFKTSVVDLVCLSRIRIDQIFVTQIRIQPYFILDPGPES